MILNRRTQHPVGQGFFHSGEVRIDQQVFRYVYDCGSENAAALRYEIDAYLQEHHAPYPNPEIDALFVSHLDSDHINGLDFLLARIRARIVVLPYLSPFERLLLIAKGLGAGASFTELLLWSDPVAWLGQRGVETVIEIHGPEKSGSPEESPVGVPPRSDDRREYSIRVDLHELEEQALSADAVSVDGRTMRVLRIDHRTAIRLGSIDWMFLSFVHPEHERLMRFEQAIQHHFSGTFDFEPRHGIAAIPHEFLLGVLQNAAERAKLADAYQRIRRDRNLTSMSLYSGPFRGEQSFCIGRSSLFGDIPQLRATDKIGWLATGDADLSRPERLAAFMRHFGDVSSWIRTVALPHHGSRHNFHSDLLSLGEVFFVAAGASNRHGHPHARVRDDVRAHSQRDLLVVTEKARSELQEAVIISD